MCLFCSRPCSLQRGCCRKPNRQTFCPHRACVLVEDVGQPHNKKNISCVRYHRETLGKGQAVWWERVSWFWGWIQSWGSELVSLSYIHRDTGPGETGPKGICGGKAVCRWRKERVEVLPGICRDWGRVLTPANGEGSWGELRLTQSSWNSRKLLYFCHGGGEVARYSFILYQ